MKPSQKILSFIVIAALTFGYFQGNGIVPSDIVNLIPFWKLMLSVLIMFLTISVHIFLHEAGHLVFGKLTGYQLISFQIPFFRYDAQTRSFSSEKSRVQGMLGQCLMSPPGKKAYEDKPYFLYLAGGVIINLITAVLLYAVSFMFVGEISFYFFLFSLLPFYFFFVNVLPYAYTDGKLLRSIKQSKVSKVLYFKQLELNALLEAGTTYDELPDDFFAEVHSGKAKESLLGEYHYIIAYQRLLTGSDFPAADQLLKDYQSNWNYMQSIYVRNLASELLFCHAIFGRKQEAKELMVIINKNEGLKAYFNHSKRAQAAYAFFVEADVEKTASTLAEESKYNRDALNNAERELEEHLEGWMQGYLLHLS